MRGCSACLLLELLPYYDAVSSPTTPTRARSWLRARHALLETWCCS